MKSFFILSLMAAVASGCATALDILEESYPQELSQWGGPTNFKYGNYCGAGHPDFETSEPGTPQRLDDLKHHQFPVDDIDLMCYAHDMCYEMAGRGSLLCDQAMFGGLGDLSTTDTEYNFELENGCRNLAHYVYSALSLKQFGSSDDGFSLAYKLSNFGVAFVGAITNMSLREEEFKKYGLPETAGLCNVINNKGRDTGGKLKGFERSYSTFSNYLLDKTGKRPTVPSIKIPIPISH